MSAKYEDSEVKKTRSQSRESEREDVCGYQELEGKNGDGVAKRRTWATFKLSLQSVTLPSLPGAVSLVSNLFVLSRM